MSAAAVVEAPAMYVGCVGVGSDGWYGGERAWATCGVLLVEGVKAASLHILCLVWLPPPSWCAATRLHWWPLGSAAAESDECFADVFIGWRSY